MVDEELKQKYYKILINNETFKISVDVKKGKNMENVLKDLIDVRKKWRDYMLMGKMRDEERG